MPRRGIQRRCACMHQIHTRGDTVRSKRRTLDLRWGMGQRPKCGSGVPAADTLGAVLHSSSKPLRSLLPPTLSVSQSQREGLPPGLRPSEHHRTTIQYNMRGPRARRPSRTRPASRFRVLVHSIPRGVVERHAPNAGRRVPPALRPREPPPRAVRQRPLGIPRGRRSNANFRRLTSSTNRRRTARLDFPL